MSSGLLYPGVAPNCTSPCRGCFSSRIAGEDTGISCDEPELGSWSDGIGLEGGDLHLAFVRGY